MLPTMRLRKAQKVQRLPCAGLAGESCVQGRGQGQGLHLPQPGLAVALQREAQRRQNSGKCLCSTPFPPESAGSASHLFFMGTSVSTSFRVQVTRFVGIAASRKTTRTRCFRTSRGCFHFIGGHFRQLETKSEGSTCVESAFLGPVVPACTPQWASCRVFLKSAWRRRTQSGPAKKGPECGWGS